MRSSACQWLPGTQSRSLKTTCVPAVRLIPTPAAWRFPSRTRTLVVVLEGGLRLRALLLGRLPREHDGGVAELRLQLLDGLGERREHDDLLARLDPLAHGLERVRHLRHREALTCLREQAEERRPRRPTSLGMRLVEGERTGLLLPEPLPVHLDRLPRPRLRREVERLGLRAAEHHSRDDLRELLDVRGPTRVQAVAVVDGGAVPPARSCRSCVRAGGRTALRRLKRSRGRLVIGVPVRR